jgi:large subunit ribosomal protein L24
MKIKKNDTVLIIAGKDRGVKGKVIQVLPEKERVIVDGANKVFKHAKPKRVGEKGERIEIFAPIHVSNVMIIDPKTSKPTRVGSKSLKDGKKVRVAKKSQEVLDK